MEVRETHITINKGMSLVAVVSCSSLMEFKGTVLFISQDREFINTIASRIVEVTPRGFCDQEVSYEEYLNREDHRRAIF